MRLLTNGYTTAASTLAGSTKIGPNTTQGGYGVVNFVIDKITVLTGGTSVAPAGTDGLVSLRYGKSSEHTMTTMTVCPQPQCTGGAALGITQVDLGPGLRIKTQWFEAITRTTAAGGVGVYIFGE